MNATTSAADVASQPESEEARRQRLELEAIAVDQLSRVNGALELQAVVLALLLPADSASAERAWCDETAGTPNPDAWRATVRCLSAAARLPWLETLLSRLRRQPLEARQSLLEATRRLMRAGGALRPIDRLYWLMMRQRLGEGAPRGGRAPAATDLSRLPQAEVSAIAAYSAFLARMVPVDASGDEAAGLAWYDSVMAPWRPYAEIAPCRAPDTDSLVHAIHELQDIAWMQRPVLVRGWVVAAQQHSAYGRLGDAAADALRLSCALLDSPLPPELARHYAAAEGTATR